jgi:6-phosphogluconolactonase
MSVTERFFADHEKMTAALLAEVAARLAQGIGSRRRASLIAAGGTTPLALYAELCRAELDWSKVDVSLTDERWISPSLDGSNEKLMRKHLFRERAASAHFVPFMTEHATPDEAEPSVHRALGEMERPFDVTLLGMGADGHMASLCPFADGLAAALDPSDPALVRAVRPRNLASAGERLSLSLRAILSSRAIVLVLRGAQKLGALREAQAGEDVLEMPVRAVLHQQTAPLQIFWAP